MRPIEIFEQKQKEASEVFTILMNESLPDPERLKAAFVIPMIGHELIDLANSLSPPWTADEFRVVVLNAMKVARAIVFGIEKRYKR